LRKENEFEVDFVIVERSHVKEMIQVTYDFSIKGIHFCIK